MDKQHNKTRVEQSRSVPEVRFPEFKEEWIIEQLGKHIKKTDKKNKENLNLPVYSINNKEGFLPQSEQFDGVNSNDRGFDISIYKIIQPNTFAYNPARINVGSIGYSNNLADILISSLYVCFQTDGKIDDNFLLAFLDTYHFKTSVLRFQEGGVRQYLFFDNLSKIKLPFPTLAEQKKIAHFFSIIDKKITQLQEKKTALELYKKGMMQQIFNQQIRFKDSNGHDFPEWEVKNLGKITTLIKDGTHGTHKNYPESEYLLLSAKNIHSGRINSDLEDRRISKEDFESIYKNYKLQKDDILLTIVGTIGRTALVKEDITKIAFQRSVAFFRFENQISNFIFQLFNHDKFQNELQRRKVVSAQPGIYLGDLAKIAISLPSLKEQTKIANFLSKIDAKINTVNTQIEHAKTYKKGLLQKMFV